MHSFIHSFIHSFMHPFIHSFIYSFIHLFILSFILHFTVIEKHVHAKENKIKPVHHSVVFVPHIGYTEEL